MTVTQYTIPDIIDIAKVSQYLYTNDISNGSLFVKRGLNPIQPFLIYRVRKSVEWMYNTDPNYSNLPQVANYLLYLCGGYTAAALAAISGGGGTAGTNPFIRPSPTEFIVSSTSKIPTDGSTLFIPAYVGYNIIFNRNSTPQSTIDDGGTYYSWDKATGLFTCVGAAAAGELFQITPV